MANLELELHSLKVHYAANRLNEEGVPFDRSFNQFDHIISLVEAAAGQREAARAFKESANEVHREMRWQYEQNINRNSDTGDSIDRLLELEKLFKYRADRMEGDE